MAGDNFVIFIAFVTELPPATAKTLLLSGYGRRLGHCWGCASGLSVAPAREEQIAAEEENQHARAQFEYGLKVARNCEGADKQKDQAQDNHAYRVGEGDHAAQQYSIANAAPRADEVSGNHCLSVTWGEGVQCADQQSKHCEAEACPQFAVPVAQAIKDTCNS